MRFASSLLVLPILLTACGGIESESKDAVRSRLKDPDSAKFGKFTRVGDTRACLTVNARNSMGGYTGDQVAFLWKKGDRWVVLQIEEVSHDNCITTSKSLGDK